jgi:hypothetical protein
MKFKMGDIVRCIGTSIGDESDEDSRYGGYGGAGWKYHRIFKIHEIVENRYGRNVYWDAMGDYGVYESHLELFEKEKKKIKKYGIALFYESLERIHNV